MSRDRRWDFLYDRERQPVKDWLLERFAEALAEELRAWPPPWADAVPPELLARHAAGTSAALPEAGVRFALLVARLELAREVERIDRLMAEEAPRRWAGEAEAAAGHLLVRLVTERCLELKEQAAARLGRDDLARAVQRAEGLLYPGS
ncbi:hypothetical protein [Anaeromyxobacter diazotrophicus]|uniref:Uncharacterized protein n=1 Tax=Anaeromyxobacter diazotrophicus TaxID=2590199 RepID=A0A7I9VTS5_9BACT|nr:hypothetical protein [Anaeromyxobacter diazotrophicus]GEJ59367.1 hypothetical protein AMYX_41080 [Anaeromyxobacter diazotrophicus]